jgi:hypothetical protein
MGFVRCPDALLSMKDKIANLPHGAATAWLDGPI